MAKHKNSPALFEVIRNAQQKQKEQLDRQRQQQIAAEIAEHSPAAALLRSPLYWFKGKHAHEAANVAEPVMREIPPAAPRPAAARPTQGAAKTEPAPAPTPVVVAPAPVPAVAPPVVAPPAPPAEPAVDLTPPPQVAAPAYAPPPRSAAAEAARQVRQELAAQEAPAAEPMFAMPAYGQTSIVSPFGFDADTDEADTARSAPIHSRFNYTTAIVAGFAIIVAVAVAVIIGNAGRADTRTVAKSAARPDVLNVGDRSPDRPETAVAKPTPAVEDDVRASLSTGGDPLALEPLGKPIPVPTDVKRVIGYQYLVLLSFPREEDAKDLVKYLAQHGVPATAERALPDYAKSWTSVVTTRGFERTKNNAEYTAYSNALKELLQRYAGKSKFRTFKIDLYTWRTAR